ncbi:MAG: hypothetical protein AAB278_09695, partial [Pseudomonadota bacterium]
MPDAEYRAYPRSTFAGWPIPSSAHPALITEVERFFSDQSPLAGMVSSFRPRVQQRDMARAVAEAIR